MGKTEKIKLVSFVVNGRTGNNIFQYLACKTVEIKYGQYK